MQRIIALLSIVAQCGAFSTLGRVSSGGSCIDEPDEVIAAETAKMGAEYAEYTTCAAIYEAGGCERADAKAACCATCSLPARMTYAGSVGISSPCNPQASTPCANGMHCQLSCTEVMCCQSTRDIEEDGWYDAPWTSQYCKDYVCQAFKRSTEQQEKCAGQPYPYGESWRGEFFSCDSSRCTECS